MKSLTVLFFTFFFYCGYGQIIHKRKLWMLGSPFEVTVVANDTVKGNEYIDVAIAETKRIENLISD